jgi:hypothetical protein
MSNVEGMYSIYFIQKRIYNPKKGIIPVGFRPNAGKRCATASRVGWGEVRNPT